VLLAVVHSRPPSVATLATYSTPIYRVAWRDLLQL